MHAPLVLFFALSNLRCASLQCSSINALSLGFNSLACVAMTIYKNEPVHSIDKHILRRKKRRIKQNKSIDMHGERETEHFELLRGFFTCYKLINPVCSVLLNYRSKTHLFFLLNNSLFPLVFFSFFFFVCLQFKRCNICLLWFSYIDFASKTDQKNT